MLKGVKVNSNDDVAGTLAEQIDVCIKDGAAPFDPPQQSTPWKTLIKQMEGKGVLTPLQGLKTRPSSSDVDTSLSHQHLEAVSLILESLKWDQYTELH